MRSRLEWNEEPNFAASAGKIEGTFGEIVCPHIIVANPIKIRR